MLEHQPLSLLGHSDNWMYSTYNSKRIPVEQQDGSNSGQAKSNGDSGELLRITMVNFGSKMGQEGVPQGFPVPHWSMVIFFPPPPPQFFFWGGGERTVKEWFSKFPTALVKLARFPAWYEGSKPRWITK